MDRNLVTCIIKITLSFFKGGGQIKRLRHYSLGHTVTDTTPTVRRLSLDVVLRPLAPFSLLFSFSPPPPSRLVQPPTREFDDSVLRQRNSRKYKVRVLLGYSTRNLPFISTFFLSTYNSNLSHSYYTKIKHFFPKVEKKKRVLETKDHLRRHVYNFPVEESPGRNEILLFVNCVLQKVVARTSCMSILDFPKLRRVQSTTPFHLVSLFHEVGNNLYVMTLCRNMDSRLSNKFDKVLRPEE